MNSWAWTVPGRALWQCRLRNLGAGRGREGKNCPHLADHETDRRPGTVHAHEFIGGPRVLRAPVRSPIRGAEDHAATTSHQACGRRGTVDAPQKVGLRGLNRPARAPVRRGDDLIGNGEACGSGWAVDAPQLPPHYW